MKKILFFSNTYMQLINAIQIRKMLKQDCAADIIISDHSNNADIIADRLNQHKIFDNVLFVKNKDIVYNQSKLEDLKDIISLCFGKAKKYRSLLWEDIPNYDEIYFYNYDFFVQILYDNIKSRNIDVKVYRYEEGITSYSFMARSLLHKGLIGLRMKAFLKFRELFKKNILLNDIDGDYVFFPEIYKNFAPKNILINKLPLLSPKNDEIIKILNFVFDYAPQNNIFKQKYLYLASPMDVDGENIGEDKLVLMIADIVGKENIIVKTHPRDNRTVYEDNGIAVNRYSSVPWELIMMNTDFSNKIFISLCSGSMITAPAVMEINLTGFYIYPIVEKSVSPFVREVIDGVDKILNELQSLGHITNCKKISDLKAIVKGDCLF